MTGSYNVGDKLKLTREDGSVFHTEVLSRRAPDFVFVRGPLKGDYKLADFTNNGWTVAEHEPVGHPLPQVDGLYQAVKMPELVYQRLDGRWTFYKNGLALLESDLARTELVRLRPEAEVAAEIADWLQRCWGHSDAARAARKKWGVK